MILVPKLVEINDNQASRKQLSSFAKTTQNRRKKIPSKPLDEIDMITDQKFYKDAAKRGQRIIYRTLDGQTRTINARSRDATTNDMLRTSITLAGLPLKSIPLDERCPARSN